MTTRRQLMQGAAASMLGLAHLPNFAQTRLENLRIIVGFPPGGTTDAFARRIAEKMRGTYANNVIVDNKAGATGTIGAAYVARAPADGYTLLFTSTAGLFVVPVMNANAKYSLSDFVPVAPVMRAPFAVLVANTPTAPKTMAELLQAVRSKPQSFASAGIGTMTHLGSELVMRKAGVQATHVPYKGSGAALTDLMGGQVLFATDSLTASMALIRSGKLRALATTDLAREGSLPDVPTLSEAGIPGVQVAAIGGLFAQQQAPAPSPTETPLPTPSRHWAATRCGICPRCWQRCRSMRCRCGPSTPWACPRCGRC